MAISAHIPISELLGELPVNVSDTTGAIEFPIAEYQDLQPRALALLKRKLADGIIIDGVPEKHGIRYLAGWKGEKGSSGNPEHPVWSPLDQRHKELLTGKIATVNVVNLVPTKPLYLHSLTRLAVPSFRIEVDGYLGNQEGVVHCDRYANGPTTAYSGSIQSVEFHLPSQQEVVNFG